MHGIELSPAMAAEMDGKPGAEHVGVTIADFATTKVGHDFTLAYLVRNTITNLTTQDEQVECFRTVADQLQPGGSFVIEVYIPELRRLPPGQTVHPFTVTPAHLGFEEYDVASQTAVSHHYWVVDGLLRDPFDTAPLRVAVRARPDGPHRRNDLARTVVRLEPRALHRRQPEPHLGLAEDVVTAQAGAALRRCTMIAAPRTTTT